MSKYRKNKKIISDKPLSEWKSYLYNSGVGDSDNFDCASVHSSTSLQNNGSECFDLSTDELSIDGLEVKLIEYLDNTSEKSAKVRTDALKKMKTILTNRVVNSFVIDRRDTICDAIKRCIKKGKGAEQENAALLASIIFIILGCSNHSEIVFEDLEPLLISYLNDKSVFAKCREYCALALSIGCFISPIGIDHLPKVMENLYNIFSGSYPNGEGVYPKLTPQIQGLHNAALNGWTLLLTILSPSNVLKIAKNNSKKIAYLLNSNDQELRLSAGETIALLYEISRVIDPDFEIDEINQLSAQMKELATYSLKFRSKKDRKIERSNFRDIIRTVKDYESPLFNIKRKDEIIELNSWTKKIQYDIFCQVLESGMLYHLGENQLIRDILNLETLPLENQSTNQRKIKKYENNEADKIRSKIMRELKGKRYDCY